MDERSCSMAPMRWCDQYPSFAKKCPQKCHGEPDNEMLNLRGKKVEWYDSNLL